MKLEVRKLGRHKGKDPKNILLHEKYHEKLRQYKRTCGKKKYEFSQQQKILCKKKPVMTLNFSGIFGRVLSKILKLIWVQKSIGIHGTPISQIYIPQMQWT